MIDGTIEVTSGLQEATLDALSGDFGKALSFLFEKGCGEQLTFTFTLPDELQFVKTKGGEIDDKEHAFLEGALSTFAILYGIETNDERIKNRYGIGSDNDGNV